MIWRSDDKQFVIAEYKRERDIVNRNCDYVKMQITINEEFQIKNQWCYVNETPSRGPLGEGISNEPLWRYQYIARYLQQKGYDIYQEEKVQEYHR